MSNRIILVERCGLCPFAHHDFDDNLRCYKTRPDSRRVKRSAPIPDWCPLPKQDPEPHEDPRGWVT